MSLLPFALSRSKRALRDGASTGSARTGRGDGRWRGVVVTALLVALGGALFGGLGPASSPTADVSAGDELQRHFDAAVVLLHSKQYEPATTQLQQVIALAPRMPEARVNMGFALLGLQRPQAAREFFEAAITLRPDQANAYYGLAMAHEGEGELELALGAMRSYLHLARDAQESHLARARAALWEWEDKLKARRTR